MNISIDQLNELFRIENGRLVWRANNGRRAIAGAEAGTENGNGYRRVSVNGFRLYSHRIIFAMAHGYLPCGFIDHINGDTRDNRISNLREVSPAESILNRGKNKNNSCGHRGVSFDKKRMAYESYVTLDYRKRHLGYFGDPELAGLVAKEARRKYHGEFARAAG